MADYRKRLSDMTDEERAEVAPGSAAYGNFLGKAESGKPLSVQMAEVGVEFTPVGTVSGVLDIKEELQKEEPDYYKIGMMAGIEAIGIIPGLGDAAIAAIKAGAKKVGLDKVADQTDALLGGPKAEDSVKTEIIAGPGAKSYGNASLLRAERLRAAGASPAQIEAETGRVKTGTPDDYLDNKPKTLADISPEYANLIGVRDYLEGYIKDLEAEDLSTWATDYPHIKDPSAYIDGHRRQLAEINEKIAKFEKANPADEAGIVVQPKNPFKFEIDDSQIEIKSSDGAQTLAEATKQYPIIVRNIIPDHKKLFEEYPGLENVEFYVDDAATYAHFDPTVGRNGAIVVNPKLKEKLTDPNNESFRNTFFHELQHAAQFQDKRIAGLEQLGGGPTLFGEIIARYPNSNSYQSLIEKNKRLVELKDEIVAIFEKHRGTGALDQRSSGATLPNQVPNPSEVFGDIKVAKQIARKMRELDAELFKTYMSTVSEIEARVVGLRAQKLGEFPTNRAVSDLSNQRDIETREEYWEGKPKGSLGKKKAQAVLKLGPITDEEILRYGEGGINFASYATGIDSELFGFDASGPLKGNYAEGGKVGNMSMKKQMSLFEYGGIADDGMTKDPVSGNNIPPGSLAKEVRDDIPAMLSEGEYVVPADVLRYYGVNFFEKLRGQAKQGLQNMEQNGRIGGTPMTEQDVARNMQQPQAAPQAMPQPILAANGTLVMGYDEGGAQLDASQYRSSWSPAKARSYSPMFQGTSSQKRNLESFQEQAAEEITIFKNHYNQQGESVQIRYVQVPGEGDPVPAPGQEELLSQYPLTEEEWLAYKKEMSRGSGGEDGGEPPTPTGSSTDWMDGIDWGDKESVKGWVESDDGLGMSKAAENIAGMGGLLGAVPQAIQAQDIAKARGIRDYYASIKDEEMVSYLDGKINEAMENPGLLTSALDKLGLMTGKTYLKQMMDLDPVVPDNVPGFKIRADRLKKKVAENAEAQKAIDDAAAQKALEAAQRAQREHRAGDDDDPFEVTNVQIDRDPMGQGTMTTTYEGIDPGLTTASFEEDPEIDFGVNKGGLMTAPKPKKKTRKYNKGGLAGKKK